MLSMLAGWQSMRFSATSAAAVTWASMKPELTPLSGVRNAGSPLIFGSTSSAMRRSVIEPISAQASARISAAKATGSAWKLPPESTSPLAANTSGLSVTAFASVLRMSACCVIRSRQAPITCGWQRSEYGSWTRAHVLDARVEGHVASEQRIHRQGAAHHRGGIDLLELEEPGECECRRYLGAVQQCEPLLGTERDRGEAFLRQRFARRQ